MYSFGRKVIISVLVCSMVIIPVYEVLPSVVSLAQAQTDWEEQLNEAEQIFYSGQFSQAEALLREALQSGELTTDQRTRAYRILGLSYLSRELENQARDAIQSLLDIVPDYAPNPEQDPPQFIRLVEDVRQEQEGAAEQQQQQTQPQTAQSQQQQPEGDLEQIIQEEQQQQQKKRRLLYIVGGAVVGVVVIAAVILLGGGGDDDGFPMPPGRP